MSMMIHRRMQRKRRILIVEDELIIAQDIANTLEGAGYTVVGMAITPDEALQQTVAQQPELVLMDIHLQETMDGIALAKQIRTTFDIPVIYLTSYADEDTLLHARESGSSGYLLKPFSSSDLHCAIEVALSKHEMEQQTRIRLEQLVRERTAELTREIEERTRTEQALKESEKQYRLLAERVAYGVGILREQKWLFVNEKLALMFDCVTAQFIGNSPDTLLCGTYKAQFPVWLKSLETAISEQCFQAECLTQDNRRIWTEWHPSLITWEARPALLLTVKDTTAQKLREIEMEQEKEQLLRENVTLRSSLKERFRFGAIIGKSPRMQTVYEKIVKAAASDMNVVIYGESGTGKELVARTIHQQSQRQQQAFVAVNCGAISESLFESELFGYRKGAFTGADRNKPGYLDAAHKGTLFLDEVGELSQGMQVKLLRVLENKEYIPVGANAAKRVDFRVIAATNTPLKTLRNQGRMREDFFYRIDVTTITLPPLRERKEDMGLLIEHFLQQFASLPPVPELTAQHTEALLNYDWPGNIRELQNELQRFLVGQPFEFHAMAESPAITNILQDSAQGPVPEAGHLRNVLENFEKHVLIHMLEKYHWHRSRTAVALDIPRRTLHRKMKKYGIS